MIMMISSASILIGKQCRYYAYDSQYQVWTDKSGDHDYVKGLVENGEDLTIVASCSLLRMPMPLP